MPEFDARLTPARSDVAAAHLEGSVRAARYVEGRVFAAGWGIVSVRAAPSMRSRLETQLFFGERFTVYDEADGWAWGQCAHDGYVGYIERHALADAGAAASHRVVSHFSHIYERADVKAPALRGVPMNAKLAVADVDAKFAALAGGGFVSVAHIAPIDARVADFVAVAEHLQGAPYLWGGRAPDGIDCSGLVQCALERAGIAAPRDSDMQERALGQAVSGGADASLRRGDLVFWGDHVGIMSDAQTLLHANSRQMAVTKDRLGDVVARNLSAGNAVTSVRRLGPQ